MCCSENKEYDHLPSDEPGITLCGLDLRLTENYTEDRMAYAINGVIDFTNSFMQPCSECLRRDWAECGRKRDNFDYSI